MSNDSQSSPPAAIQDDSFEEGEDSDDTEEKEFEDSKKFIHISERISTDPMELSFLVPLPESVNL
jgi:hypothetical protein